METVRRGRKWGIEPRCRNIDHLKIKVMDAHLKIDERGEGGGEMNSHETGEGRRVYSGKRL